MTERLFLICAIILLVGCTAALIIGNNKLEQHHDAFETVCAAKGGTVIIGRNSKMLCVRTSSIISM